MIKQISTSSCETIYDVDGNIIRLFVITGGTPAISFNNGSFVQRYPDLPKYSNENWLKDFPHHSQCHFKHQDTKNIQGITYDELPNGEQTIYDYIKENLPKKQLAEQRYNDLPIKFVESKGKRDKENHTVVRAQIDFRLNGVSPVTFCSGCYWGRHDEKVVLFHEWWKAMQELCNPIFDSGKYGWHEISQEQYDVIKYMMEK